MSADSMIRVSTVQNVTTVRFVVPELVILDDVRAAETRLDELVQRGHRKFILDFSEVQALSSAMMSILLAFRRRVADLEGQIIIGPISEGLATLFRITNLQTLFEFCDDPADALERLAATAE